MFVTNKFACRVSRRSYAERAEFWPVSDIEPFATFINGVAKYVAMLVADVVDELRLVIAPTHCGQRCTWKK